MPLLLADEPTAGLDPVACTRIEDLIVKTTTVAQGCSVVVSHVRSTIERSAERVVMLYDGRFQWEGSVDAFRTTDNPYVVQFRTGSLRGPMQPAEHLTAMRRSVRDAIVGFTLIGSIIGFASTALWLKAFDWGQPLDPDRPVR